MNPLIPLLNLLIVPENLRRGAVVLNDDNLQIVVGVDFQERIDTALQVPDMILVGDDHRDKLQILLQQWDMSVHTDLPRIFQNLMIEGPRNMTDSPASFLPGSDMLPLAQTLQKRMGAVAVQADLSARIPLHFLIHLSEQGRPDKKDIAHIVNLSQQDRVIFRTECRVCLSALRIDAVRVKVHEVHTPAVVLIQKPHARGQHIRCQGTARTCEQGILRLGAVLQRPDIPVGLQRQRLNKGCPVSPLCMGIHTDCRLEMKDLLRNLRISAGGNPGVLQPPLVGDLLMFRCEEAVSDAYRCLLQTEKIQIIFQLTQIHFKPSF